MAAPMAARPTATVCSSTRSRPFTEAMTALAKLRRPVDAFFDRVTVNTDEPQLRENRLRLLARIRSALDTIADFSLIEDTQAQERRVA